MGLQELYEGLGGDFAHARAYLRSERLIERLIVKFLDDTSCQRAIAAWERKDAEACFEAAHEAKGVCANLSLVRLHGLTSRLTEAVRPRGGSGLSAAQTDELVVELKREHARALGLIRQFADGR